MRESRDRRSKPVDIAAVFARRRAGIIGVLDEEVESGLLGSTPRRVTTTSTVAGEAIGFGATGSGGGVRGSFGTPRARNLYGLPAVDGNIPSGTARRGRHRPRQSALPSWYPRTPLRDVTAVVRAIERRVIPLGENQGQQPGSPFPADQLVIDPPLSVSVVSPNPAAGLKLRTPAGSKLPKILVDITRQSDGESEFLTPQKKLLNSIDTVEKVVREEIQKLKRTPSAKKADREKRVRTLMSLR